MHRQEQSNIVRHRQGGGLFDSNDFTRRTNVVPAQEQYQYSSAQHDLNAHRAYGFANPLPSSHLAPNEPFSLMNRPIEDVHLGPPHAQSQNTYNFPNFPALRMGPYGFQWDADTTDNSYIPSAPQEEGLFSASRWDPAIAPYNPTPSSSTPRARLPPMDNPAYAPSAPAHAATVGFSNTPNNHFPWPSLLDAPSHTSFYHEALPPPNPMRANILPGSAPTPPYPAQTSAVLGHSGSVPGIDTVGTRYGSGGPMAEHIPAEQFQPLHHEQSHSRMSMSSQPGSSYEQSKRLQLEASPAVRQNARSGKQAQTLKSNKSKTQANDPGHEATLDQCAARYLFAPLQGSSTLPSAPRARAKTGRRKTGENRIPNPPCMPKVIKVGQNKYQCPYAKCPTTCTSVHDVERHYWKHLPVRVKWNCTLCGGSFTRSYNATRHVKKAHHTEGPREGDIIMDWPLTNI